MVFQFASHLVLGWAGPLYLARLSGLASIGLWPLGFRAEFLQARASFWLSMPSWAVCLVFPCLCFPFTLGASV